MNKDRYVFAQLVQFMDRNHFNYLVRKYDGDRYVTSVSSYCHSFNSIASVHDSLWSEAIAKNVNNLSMVKRLIAACENDGGIGNSVEHVRCDTER